MTAYVILLLVLVGIILVASAFLDRRRAREIERDLAARRPGRAERQRRDPDDRD